MNAGLDLCSLCLQCIAIILVTNMKQFTNSQSTVQAQSLERFDANACQQNADDVISCQISYVTCLDECRSRWRCVGVSYHRRLSLCRLHMTLLSSGTTQCVGYVLSTKTTWSVKTSNQCQCDGQNTCTSNGIPSCQDCPVNFPVAPEHGYIRGNRRVVGSKVAFGCDVGFTLQGDMTSVCEITGQWANYTVTCHNTSQTLTSTTTSTTTSTASSTQTPIVLGAPTAAPTSSSTTRTTSALSTTKRTTSAIPTTSTNASTTSMPTPIAPTSTIPATSTNVSTTSMPTPIMTMSSTTSTTLSITSTNASTTSTASTASTTNTTYSTTSSTASSTASTTNERHPLTTSTTASTTNTTTISTSTPARTTIISTTHSTTSSNTSLTTANSVATCKDSWVMGNASCYLIQDFALTYAEHQTLCVLNGGHLVFINSPEENAFIKRIASNYITVRFNSLRMAWFGIDDYDLDGQWNFTDTPTEVTWYDWGVSQPQKWAYGRWQRCGCIMYNKNSIWHDCWCGYEMPAICENEL